MEVIQTSHGYDDYINENKDLESGDQYITSGTSNGDKETME